MVPHSSAGRTDEDGLEGLSDTVGKQNQDRGIGTHSHTESTLLRPAAKALSRKVQCFPWLVIKTKTQQFPLFLPSIFFMFLLADHCAESADELL